MQRQVTRQELRHLTDSVLRLNVVILTRDIFPKPSQIVLDPKPHQVLFKPKPNQTTLIKSHKM